MSSKTVTYDLLCSRWSVKVNKAFQMPLAICKSKVQKIGLVQLEHTLL